MRMGGLERECVRHAILRAALTDLGAIELEHLGRRIGHDELVGEVCQQAGPLARARGDLEHAAARRECAQRVSDALRIGAEGVVGGLGGGVVLGGPGAVVRDLLVEQLAVGCHQRRSAGTPSVTAAATVAVASARAWLAERSPPPPKSWVAGLGIAARMTGMRVQPRTSTVGAVAPGRRSVRVTTAVRTPRNAASSRMRMSAGWSRAPEALTRLMMPR